jgi:hypothetical protein
VLLEDSNDDSLEDVDATLLDVLLDELLEDESSVVTALELLELLSLLLDSTRLELLLDEDTSVL